MLDCTVMVAIEFTITSFFGRKKVNIPKLRCHGIDVFISHVVVDRLWSVVHVVHDDVTDAATDHLAIVITS